MRQKLVSKPLALARTLNESSNIHKLKRGRRNLFAVVQRRQLREPLIGHRNYAHVRLYRAKRIVCRLRSRLGYRVKQSALADVWQTHNT